MTIPPNKLLPYLDFVTKALGPLPSSSHKIRIKNQDGSLWVVACPSEIKILADKGQVFGIGTPTQLKYVQLECSPEEAKETLDDSQKAKWKVVVADRPPIAEDNYTVRHVNESTGQWWEHRNKVCAAYER